MRIGFVESKSRDHPDGLLHSCGECGNSEASQSPSAPGQQEALAFTGDGWGYYLIPEGRDAKISFVAERDRCPRFNGPEPRADVVSPVVEEISGLAISTRNTGVLWAINDSGKGTSRNILTSLTSNGEHIADTELVGQWCKWQAPCDCPRREWWLLPAG